MNILAFFDPSPEQADAAIEVAVALADHCILTGRELSLVCDGVTALEVGVAVMGLVDAPTVEGGDRSPSHIRILGLIGPREEPSAPKDGEAMSDLGPLDQLRADGIFAELNMVPLGAEAMQEMIHNASRGADIAFGLGTKEALWRAAVEGVRERHGYLIGIEGFVPSDSRLGENIKTLSLLEPALTGGTEEGLIGEDALRFSTEARLAGQAVGTVLEFLSELDGVR
jgi:hypothetical protein